MSWDTAEQVKPNMNVLCEYTVHCHHTVCPKCSLAVLLGISRNHWRLLPVLFCQQDAPCVSLHAWNLSFSSISAQLIGASWLQPPQPQQQAGADVCLCGPDPTCIVQECGRLFKPRPGEQRPLAGMSPMSFLVHCILVGWLRELLLCQPHRKSEADTAPWPCNATRSWGPGAVVCGICQQGCIVPASCLQTGEHK